MSKEITRKERNAIEVEKAYANSYGLNNFLLDAIYRLGVKVELETVFHKYELRQIFGKLYAV